MGSLSQEEFRHWSMSQATYERRRPETTLLYQIVEEHWPAFQVELGIQGKYLPKFIIKEFEEYLKCGRLEHGFLRVRCESCHNEKLVAFSCKRRGFCPSCGARRMADSAAHLVDEVLPEKPIRQWVLSVPFQLRYLFATQPQVMSKVLTIVHRAISTFLSRLVSLVPKPRTNLTRFHGVFSRGGHPPNSKLRRKIVPEKPVQVEIKCEQKSKRYGMHWAQRLKRVFAIEIEKCEKCGGNAERRPVGYREY